MIMKTFSLFVVLLVASVSWSQWIPETLPSSIDMVLSVHTSGSSKAIAGGWELTPEFTARGVYSPDGGKTWYASTAPAAARAMVTVKFADRESAYCAGAINVAGKRRPAALTASVPPGVQREMERTGYRSGDTYAGLFMRSTDAGKNWFAFGNLPDSTDYLFGLAMTAPTTVYVTGAHTAPGHPAVILRSFDGGLNWTPLPVPAEARYLRWIQFVDCLTGYAGGYRMDDSSTSAVLLKTTDGGDTWHPQVFPSIGEISAMWFSSSGIGFVCGPTEVGTALLFNTTNGGATWTEHQWSTHQTLVRAVQFLAGTSTGYLVGQDLVADTNGIDRAIPFIDRTTDGGATWHATTIEGDSSEYLVYSLTLVSVDEALACGQAPGLGGLILHTTNGGATFVAPPGEGIPVTLSLLGTYPNPFNGMTRIGYRMPAGIASGTATLSIWNLLGQPMREPIALQAAPGDHWIPLDATGFPSGTYIVRITAPGMSASGRFMVLK